MTPRKLSRLVVTALLIAFLPSLVSEACLAAPWSKDNAAWNINFNPDGSDPSRYFGKWPGHHYTPSPDDWRKLAIYHLMTDRFSDGEPRNNEGKYGGYDPGKFNTRHGGDFAGLTNKLDYIKSLGFDAILISPIFQNLENEYHGYGQIDFTLLDDRLGTLEEFRRLIDAAHAREMYVIVDVVVNHMSYLFFNEGHENSLAPFHLHQGEYRLLHRTPGVEYQDFKVDNTFDPEGRYCTVYDFYGHAHEPSGKGTFSTSDFHHNGELTDYYDAWNTNLGQIYGSYNDLRLCAPRVQNKLVAMTNALISSTDIDGIRIDTPMQVPLPFFKTWTPAVKAHAASLGKKNFFMFGEMFVSSQRAATMIGRGKTPEQYGTQATISPEIAMDAGIDYLYHLNLIQRVRDDQSFDISKTAKELSNLEHQRYDLVNPLSGKEENRMLNFYDGHDRRRMVTFKDGEGKARALSTFIAFWPGIPLYYYGDEQGLSSYGTGLDGHARESMMTSIAWNRHPFTRGLRGAGIDQFDMASPKYVETQSLFLARKAYSDILASDAWELRERSEATPSTLVFSRGLGERSLLIAINFSSNPVAVTVSLPELLGTAARATRLRDIVAGHILKSDNQGEVSFDLKPWESLVLSPAPEPLRPPLRVLAHAPRHDVVVAPNAPLAVSVTFSESIGLEAFCRAALVNGDPIDCEKATIDEKGTSVSFSLTSPDGIVALQVRDTLHSTAGNKMSAAFHSRFRVGLPSNRLMTQSNMQGQLLINNGAQMTRNPAVTLTHHATGAALYRVLNVGESTWSAWLPYAPQSTFQLSAGGGWKEIAVQYWAEGSGAYYVQSGIDLVRPDGINIGR